MLRRRGQALRVAALRVPLLTAAGCVAGSLIAGCGGSGLQTSRPPKAVSPASSTVIFDCGGKAEVEPHSLTLACADDGISLQALRWRDWGTKAATATGLAYTMTCKPSCYQGKTVKTNAAITITDLELRGTHIAYTKLTLMKWPLGKPQWPTGQPVSTMRDQIYTLTANGPAYQETETG